MLWINHGPCLIPLGASTAEFYREVRLEIARFVRRLERGSAICHPKPVPVLTPAV
jgi:hypothetical protein